LRCSELKISLSLATAKVWCTKQVLYLFNLSSIHQEWFIFLLLVSSKGGSTQSQTIAISNLSSSKRVAGLLSIGWTIPSSKHDSPPVSVILDCHGGPVRFFQDRSYQSASVSQRWKWSAQYASVSASELFFVMSSSPATAITILSILRSSFDPLYAPSRRAHGHLELACSRDCEVRLTKLRTTGDFGHR